MSQNRPQLVRTALAAALATLLLTPAQAAQIGQVLFANGDVRIVAPDGSSRAARQGDPVQHGERLVTGDGALGQVKMLDGGFVGVRPGSDLTFEPPAAPGAQAPTVLNLGNGSVRVLNVQSPAASDAPAPRPVVLKTPDGRMQVERADLQAVIAPLPGSPGGERQTFVKLERGLGSATDGAGNAVPLRPGVPVAVARNRLESLPTTAPEPAIPQLSTRLGTAREALAGGPVTATPLGPRPGLDPGLTVRPVPPPATVPATAFAGMAISPTLTRMHATSQVRVEDKLSVNPAIRQPTRPVLEAPVVAATAGRFPSLELTTPTPVTPTPTSATTSNLTTLRAGTVLNSVITGGSRTPVITREPTAGTTTPILGTTTPTIERFTVDRTTTTAPTTGTTTGPTTGTVITRDRFTLRLR